MPDFKEWKAEVSRILIEDCDWPDNTVRAIDWVAWEEGYFRDGLTPTEAIAAEFENQ